nr:MAG TPA: hypothetical protein [Caudoviricetes sp.]
MLCSIASDFIPGPNNFFGILVTLLELSYSILLHESPHLIRHFNPYFLRQASALCSHHSRLPFPPPYCLCPFTPCSPWLSVRAYAGR